MAVDEIAFAGEVVEWRGPAPFYFVAMPPDDAARLKDAAICVSYGWGCVPVVAVIGDIRFATSLIPRGGSYLLPLKAAVRRAIDAAPGERVHATVALVSRGSRCSE